MTPEQENQLINDFIDAEIDANRLSNAANANLERLMENDLIDEKAAGFQAAVHMKAIALALKRSLGDLRFRVHRLVVGDGA